MDLVSVPGSRLCYKSDGVGDPPRHVFYLLSSMTLSSTFCPTRPSDVPGHHRLIYGFLHVFVSDFSMTCRRRRPFVILHRLGSVRRLYLTENNVFSHPDGIQIFRPSSVIWRRSQRPYNVGPTLVCQRPLYLSNTKNKNNKKWRSLQIITESWSQCNRLSWFHRIDPFFSFQFGTD